MSKNYPRLAEQFGKRYSWQVMLNPRVNMKERCHPKVGDIYGCSRDSYHKKWEKVLRKRERPTRQAGYRSQLDNFITAPGASIAEPQLCSLSERVRSSLSKVRTPQLSELINLGNIIGSGVEGVVRPGQPRMEVPAPWQELSERFHNKRLAVKTVEKRNRYSSEVQTQCRESEVLGKICVHQHPNVTPYLYTFESPVRFHIITEYNEGGDMFSYLLERDFQPLKENEAARVLMQLVCAVQHIHEAGYVHLDLKLENVMRRKKGSIIDEGGICLIDFGHASRIPEQEFRRLARPVGSPSYAAPEIVLEKKYSIKSDAWSLGVIMYILLQGFLPFPHLQHKVWREFSYNDYGCFDKKIQEHDPFFYEGDWADISPEAKDLCSSLLNVNVNDRMRVNEIFDHKWFKRCNVEMIRNTRSQPILNIKENLKQRDSYSFSKRLFGDMY